MSSPMAGEFVCTNREVLFGLSSRLSCNCGVTSGPLMGGLQCRMSILRNGNVACPCRLFYPMSHVKFKNRLCHTSL